MARSHWQEAGLSGDDLDKRMGILVVPDVAAGTACYLVFVLWYDTSKTNRKFLYMNKRQAQLYLIPAIRALRLATGIIRLLRAFFRRKPVSMLRYVDGADVFIEKVEIYAHDATAAAADHWYDALRRNLGDRVTFDRKGVRGAAQRIDILWPWRVQEPFFGGVRLNSKETRPQTELAARKTLASQTFSGLPGWL